MGKDLPEDDDLNNDDGPVRVAYHRAPMDDSEDDPPKKNEEYDLDDDQAEMGNDEDEDKLDEIEDEEDSFQSKRASLDQDDDPRDKKTAFDEEKSEDPKNDSLSYSKHHKGSSPETYFLQTVHTGEQPEWQVDKEEVDVFSQPIDDGLTQYWAYPKELGKTEDTLPNAEAQALKNKSSHPVIIIDQIKDHLTQGCCLELILAKGGHALAKTDSNLENLEANISSLIDTARRDFDLKVEHFLSTQNVSPEVERSLDDLEDGGEEEAPEKPTPSANFQQASVYNQDQYSGPLVPPRKDGSKAAVLIPVVIVILIGAGIFYRDQISSMLNFSNQEVNITPTEAPTPSPTPTIEVDRTKYSVRVLNGTTKTGAAGTLADSLKEEGWQIDKTGNASSNKVEQSYIKAKEDTPEEVVKALQDDIVDYNATVSAEVLKASDKADLEFVIGKE